MTLTAAALYLSLLVLNIPLVLALLVHGLYSPAASSTSSSGGCLVHRKEVRGAGVNFVSCERIYNGHENHSADDDDDDHAMMMTIWRRSKRTKNGNGDIDFCERIRGILRAFNIQ